jgi:hypothetical protein
VRRAIEGVRVEEARQRAGLQTLGRLEHRPEEVLPAQHPVGQQVEGRLLLNRDELRKVAFDLLVDGLLRSAPPVEVSRRLDESLGPGLDAGNKGFHGVS